MVISLGDGLLKPFCRFFQESHLTRSLRDIKQGCSHMCYFALKMDRLDDILKNDQLYCSTVAWEIPMLVVAWLKAHPHVY